MKLSSRVKEPENKMTLFWKKNKAFVGSFIQQDPEKIIQFFSKKKKALKVFCKGRL